MEMFLETLCLNPSYLYIHIEIYVLTTSLRFRWIYILVELSGCSSEDCRMSKQNHLRDLELQCRMSPSFHTTKNGKVLSEIEI